jgi:protein associated with RNAse G/E
MDSFLKNNHFPRWIKVQAYKHDGLLHREWSPAYLAEENEEYWALCSRSSLVSESDGRRWMTKEHAVFILYKHKWMNIICMMKEGGGICYYVNIASPTILDDGFLRYIDYDLDVKLFPDGTVKELDELEFERHVLTYGYSPELTSAINKACEGVKELMKQRAFPFQQKDVARLYQKFLDMSKPFEPKKFEKGESSKTKKPIVSDGKTLTKIKP